MGSNNSSVLKDKLPNEMLSFSNQERIEMEQIDCSVEPLRVYTHLSKNNSWLLVELYKNRTRVLAIDKNDLLETSFTSFGKSALYWQPKTRLVENYRKKACDNDIEPENAIAAIISETMNTFTLIFYRCGRLDWSVTPFYRADTCNDECYRDVEILLGGGFSVLYLSSEHLSEAKVFEDINAQSKSTFNLASNVMELPMEECLLPKYSFSSPPENKIMVVDKEEILLQSKKRKRDEIASCGSDLENSIVIKKKATISSSIILNNNKNLSERLKILQLAVEAETKPYGVLGTRISEICDFVEKTMESIDIYYQYCSSINFDYAYILTKLFEVPYINFAISDASKDYVKMISPSSTLALWIDYIENYKLSFINKLIKCEKQRVAELAAGLSCLVDKMAENPHREWMRELDHIINTQCGIKKNRNDDRADYVMTVTFADYNSIFTLKINCDVKAVVIGPGIYHVRKEFELSTSAVEYFINCLIEECSKKHTPTNASIYHEARGKFRVSKWECPEQYLLKPWESLLSYIKVFWTDDTFTKQLDVSKCINMEKRVLETLINNQLVTKYIE